MKKSIIWRKGKQQFFCGLINLQGTGRTREYTTITDIESEKDNEVTIENTENGVVMSCTCLSKTFHIDKPTICSHIVTLILYKCGKEKLK